MFFKLFLLFTVTPMVELYLLIKLGQVVGAMETVSMVILIGLAGAALARSQGYAVIEKFQEAARRGEMPADQIIDGLLIVAGGALLVTPGVLTDFMGLAMVAPPTRIFFRKYIKSRIAVSMKGGNGFFYYSGGHAGRPGTRRDMGGKNDDVIDV